MDGTDPFSTPSHIGLDASPSVSMLGNEQAKLTDQLITALGGAVEAKDRYTSGHSLRVARYSAEIARRIGWNEERCLRVYYAGILHDVGKIGISDAILTKDGPLTEEEYAVVKQHTLMGYHILKDVSTISDFAIGARWHHERYDGKGYPNGLSHENIPLIARIISVADAYDSMTSYRCYRPTMPQSRARREIENGLGTQFDPVVGTVMLQMIDEDTAYEMHQITREDSYVILAIDDDPLEIKLLDFIIGKNPRCTLLKATSGEEGLALMKERHVDVVLLDLEMPGMNGFEVLERMRMVGDETPVVFLTGEKNMGNILKAESMGVNDYLTKPIVARTLKVCLDNILLSNIRKGASWQEGHIL